MDHKATVNEVARLWNVDHNMVTGEVSRVWNTKLATLKMTCQLKIQNILVHNRHHFTYEFALKMCNLIY